MPPEWPSVEGAAPSRAGFGGKKPVGCPVTVRLDATGLWHVSASRIGYRRAEEECGHEVEKGRPDDRLRGRQDVSRHHGSDRIGSVVKTVDEIENQRDPDDDDSELEDRQRLAVFHHDGLQHVSHVLTAIDGSLNEVVNFFQLWRRPPRSP